jgi:hypothetical protein
VRSDSKGTTKREREISIIIEPLLTGVGATSLECPYKLGIYTPKLGLKIFQLITNMARSLMDSVNTAIRCPYSTLPRKSGKKRNIQILQIYEGE